MLIFLSLLLAALASPRRVESDPKFYIHDFGRPEAVDLYPPLHAKLLPFTNASDMIFSEKYAANEGFGEYDLHTRTFSTWQVALFRNVYSRLARSRRRTRAAAAASLFFIPYDAGVETYIYRDGTFRGGGNPLAKVISKYLNNSAVFKRRYGADHFMIYSASLLSQGISSKLKRLFRICANVTIFTFETYEASGQKKFQGFNLPHLTAVPYPSIYHWNEREGDRSLPVLHGGRGGSRPLFSSLLASTLTNQPDSNKLRRLLMQQCRDADTRRSDLYERLCWYHDIGSRDQRNNFNVSAVGEVYGASVFCLMPPGDTNTRRGIFDAVLCGCIPVLFEYPGSPKPVNPIRQYHWHFSAEEMENGFVFFNGSDTNYFEILSSISAEEIQKRQSYLRRVAFKTQYSLPSPILARPRAASRALPPVQEVLEPWEPPESDAADVILDTLFGMVRSRPEQID